MAAGIGAVKGRENEQASALAGGFGSAPWIIGLALLLAGVAMFFAMRSETSADRAPVVAAEQAEVLGRLTAVSTSDTLKLDGITATVQGDEYCLQVQGFMAENICAGYSEASPFFVAMQGTDVDRVVAGVVPYAIEGFDVETGLIVESAEMVTDREHTLWVVRGDLVDAEADLLVEMYEGTVLRTSVQVTLVR